MKTFVIILTVAVIVAWGVYIGAKIYKHKKKK